jgi:hypothetical protein
MCGLHQLLAQHPLQITKYVEREIMNQLRLKHPHIIAIREVRRFVKLPGRRGIGYSAGTFQHLLLLAPQPPLVHSVAVHLRC